MGALLTSGLVLPAHAQTSLHDEDADGDLSGLISAPTSLTLPSAGDFTVRGTVTNSDQDDVFAPGLPFGDYDVFAMTVPTNFQIDAITLDAFGGGGRAFIGVQAGPVLTVNTAVDGQDFPAVAGGFTLVQAVDVGNDILPDLIAGLSSAQPALPLNNPVSAGTYAFAVQNTGTELNSYTLGFTVTEVPEPGLAVCVGALGAVALRRRSAPCVTRS